MAGYIRQSSAVIINGGTINASDSNNEYNVLQAAFDATTGHAHDGSSGSGPKLVLTASASISGVLPLANGGTNTSTTLTTSGVVLGGASFTATAAGTADQVLVIPHAGGAPVFGQVNLAQGAAITGALLVANGGTGQTSYTNGQLLIGNATGNTLALGTLTAGSQIAITNGTGTITIATSGLVIGTNIQAWDTDLDGLAALATTGYVKRTGAGTFTAGTAVSLTADVSGILPTANGGTGIAFFTVSGPAASAKTFTFPNANAAVLTDNAIVTAAQGGTGQSSYTDGQLLIGNTSTGFISKSTITAGTGIGIANGNGTITISSTATGSSSTIKSASYTIVSGDNNNLLVMNSTATATFTLPAASTSATDFTVKLKHLTEVNLTLVPNGTDTIDGVNATVRMPSFDTWELWRISSTGWVIARRGQHEVGNILPHGSTTVPTGWLICDGAAVNRTSKGNLFAALSTNFGVGDGSTTFNTPDMRGRVPAGVDNMGVGAASRLGSGSTGGITGTASLGSSGGEQSHTLTGAESGTSVHAHTATSTFTGNAMLAAIADASAGTSNIGSDGHIGNVTPTGSVSTTVNNSSAANASNAHNLIQPTLVVGYIIKT